MTQQFKPGDIVRFNLAWLRHQVESTVVCPCGCKPAADGQGVLQAMLAEADFTVTEFFPIYFCPTCSHFHEATADTEVSVVLPFPVTYKQFTTARLLLRSAALELVERPEP